MSDYDDAMVMSLYTNFPVLLAAAQYPHYLTGPGPHDLQAAATAYGSLHNNLPPALNTYPRPPLVRLSASERYGDPFGTMVAWM